VVVLIGHTTRDIQEKKETPEERRAKQWTQDETEVKGAPPGPLSLLPHLTLYLTPSLHFIQSTSTFIVSIRQLSPLLFYLRLPPSDAIYFPCL
jgi:hypothetical protein